MSCNLKIIIARGGAGLLLALLIAINVAGQSAYRRELKNWREEQERELKADDGWLTVAGLYWLKEGPNRVGTAADNDMILPAGSAPGKTATFELTGGVVTLRVAEGAGVTVAGERVRQLVMKPDTDPPPTIVKINDLTMLVIKRGERYGIRLKDKNSRLRREFKGMRWFPAEASYRVTARFVPHAQPTELAVPNVLGDVIKMESSGTLFFTLNGREYSLEPVSEEGQLFIIFRDLTSGKQSYPAGRFLYADAPVGGQVTLDFNKAVNPPCAFTPYATCPLPPKQNRLRVAIRAGELTHHATP
ncbi:MAG TPA: DUF1684 domain-containing protein [Pyrinomonadaceae bacterium]|jgi:uncharacterized protein (DUF1684 family)